jgi:5,10-methylenetetrahydromethanopterin reductase
MRISIGYAGSTPLPLTIAAVDAAEAAGLSGIWSAEHVGMNDAIVPSALYAARTKNLEIGAMGLNADTRSPGVLAMELATLNTLAPGRVRLHVGTGSPQRAAMLGVSTPRTLKDVENFIDTLRGLLRGESVTVHSDVFSLEDMRISTVDTSLPPVPIDIMAIRPKMTALAGRIADGLSLSVLCSHDYLRSQVKLIEQTLEQEGRDRSTFRVSASVLASIEPDLDLARTTMANDLASFPLGLPEMVAGLDVPDVNAIAEAKSRGGAAEVANLFSTETIEALGLVATPDTLASALDRFRADGIDELIVMPRTSPELHPALINLLGTYST